jgi:hypothetical protein
MTTKQQKLFKRLAFINSAKLFNKCLTCGNERESVKFEDLPEASKIGFNELLKQEPFKSGATFLYCRKCKNYSILSHFI